MNSKGPVVLDTEKMSVLFWNEFQFFRLAAKQEASRLEAIATMVLGGHYY